MNQAIRRRLLLKKGQSTVEYILVVSAVVATILLFLKPSGIFQRTLNGTYGVGSSTMDSVSGRRQASVIRHHRTSVPNARSALSSYTGGDTLSLNDFIAIGVNPNNIGRPGEFTVAQLLAEGVPISDFTDHGVQVTANDVATAVAINAANGNATLSQIGESDLASVGIGIVDVNNELRGFTQEDYDTVASLSNNSSSFADGGHDPSGSDSGISGGSVGVGGNSSAGVSGGSGAGVSAGSDVASVDFGLDVGITSEGNIGISFGENSIDIDAIDIALGIFGLALGLPPGVTTLGRAVVNGIFSDQATSGETATDVATAAEGLADTEAAVDAATNGNAGVAAGSGGGDSGGSGGGSPGGGTGDPGVGGGGGSPGDGPGVGDR